MLLRLDAGGAQQPRMPDIGMLVENGQVAKVICAFTAATRPTDVLPFTKYYESGEVEGATDATWRVTVLQHDGCADLADGWQ